MPNSKPLRTTSEISWDLSWGFVEKTQSKDFKPGLLDCRSRLIDDISTIGYPDQNPRRTRSVGRFHETNDSLGDIVRIRRVLPREHLLEGLAHLTRNSCDVAVACGTLGVCGHLKVSIKAGGVRAWLHRDDINVV